MTLGFAKALAGLVGLGAEFVREGIRTYFEKLARTIIRTLILVWVGFLSMIGGVYFQSLSLTVAGFALFAFPIIFLCWVAIPASLVVELIAKWEPARKRIEGLINLVVVTHFLIFVIALDNLYEHPVALKALVGLFSFLALVTLMPIRSPVVESMWRWFRRLAIIPILAVTANILYANFMPTVYASRISNTIDEALAAKKISYHLNAQGNFLNDAGGPISFFKRTGPAGARKSEPTKAYFQDPDSKHYDIYELIPGQASFDPTGNLLLPMTPEIFPKFQKQARIEESKRLAEEQKKREEESRIKATVEPKTPEAPVPTPTTTPNPDALRKSREDHLAMIASDKRQIQLGLVKPSVPIWGTVEVFTLKGFNDNTPDKDGIVTYIESRYQFADHQLGLHDIVYFDIVGMDKEWITLQPRYIHEKNWVWKFDLRPYETRPIKISFADMKTVKGPSHKYTWNGQTVTIPNRYLIPLELMGARKIN